jgi:polysaccharide biosynthesis protein PslG
MRLGLRLRAGCRSFPVVMLLALLLAVPVLAACGGDDDDDSTATTEGTTTSATAESGDATGTTGADDEDSSPATTDGTEPASGSPTEDVPAFATATTGSDQPVNTPAPTNTPATTANVPSGFAYGWNVALRGDRDSDVHNEQTIQAVLDSGFTWVRFQLEWSQFERNDDQWDPLPLDRKIDALNAAGINILLVINKAPDWAIGGPNGEFLADYQELAELTSFVANRYAGKVQAYEIWNEQNLAHEVGGNVQVEDYFEILRAGSEGVRAGDPNALVVFGGLTPNGMTDPSIAIDDVEYLKLIYQYRGGEISQYFDIMGAHVNSTHNPPDTMWPDNPSDEEGWNDDDSFYFRRAEQLRQVMVDAGDEAKPMWLTEFGWTTENQAAGYEYGANNTEEEVADYLVRSFEICATEWDWCTGAFAWNLNWSTLTPPEDEKFPWSALNADWSPRPAYDALTAMPKE